MTTLYIRHMLVSLIFQESQKRRTHFQTKLTMGEDALGLFDGILCECDECIAHCLSVWSCFFACIGWSGIFFSCFCAMKYKCLYIYICEIHKFLICLLQVANWKRTKLERERILPIPVSIAWPVTVPEPTWIVAGLPMTRRMRVVHALERYFTL